VWAHRGLKRIRIGTYINIDQNNTVIIIDGAIIDSPNGIRLRKIKTTLISVRQ